MPNKPQHLSQAVGYDDQGIFGNAYTDMQKADATLVREGVKLTFRCPGCGLVTDVTLEWPELMALKYNLNPAVVFRQFPGHVQHPMSWQYNAAERAWAPDATCDSCPFHFGLRLSPDEPARYLKQAWRAGLLSPQGTQQVEALCKQLQASGQAAGLQRTR